MEKQTTQRKAKPPSEAAFLMDENTPREDVKPLATGTETVIVGCRAPLGLILRVFDAVERRVPVLGGGLREEIEYRPHGKTYKVDGPARAIGEDSPKLIRNGAALTYGIPRDFWERWERENEGSPLLENKIIFAEDTAGRTADQAREYRAMRTGLEPLNGASDPRIPKPSHKAVAPIAPRSDD